MATITKLVCDICGSPAQHKQKQFTVSFDTNQTDGYPCQPYLSAMLLDLCEVCLGFISKNNVVFASGAQGHNKFRLSDLPEKYEDLKFRMDGLEK